MKPLTGLQPDQQTGPISPVDPIGPGGPIGPIVPIDPIEPFDPKDPVDPEDEEVTSPYKVGTPKGTFSVSSAGAATYNVAIEAPNGGGLEPGIGVAYSSQSGNGLAGYGFNITGISCITRGNRDLFHDNTISGTTFGLGDVFYLDGKRLMLKSGSYGYNGSVYAPEGDPFTIITLHNSSVSPTSWFSITGKDGKTYEFGNTTDSRLTFTNRKGTTNVAAWYVNKIADAHNNLIKYHYNTSNYNLRPVSIEYGLNSAKSRGITNLILFSYNSLSGNYARPFAIGDRQGKMDVCLSKIITQTNGTVYREYDFTYDSSSDGTANKYYRLTKIDLKNGIGESLSPIRINWNFLPSEYISTGNINVSTSDKDFGVWLKEHSKNFIAIDINNDGISDIIRISPGTWMGSNPTNKTFLFVSLSKKNTNGEVSYQKPKMFELEPSFSIDDLKNIIGDIQAMDFDGDGYNDLIIPYYSADDREQGFKYYAVLGRTILGAIQGTRSFDVQSFEKKINCGKLPLLATSDFNGDGKDELIYLEVKARNGYYYGAIESAAIFNEYGAISVHSQPIKFRFPKDPQKIFVGDYNHDGLTDIIVFYDGGYKIYFNNGGALTSDKYTEGNTKQGTNLGNNFRMAQGDFNGDGLPDFVFHQDKAYGLALNNGDGTFFVNNNAISLNVINQSTSKDNDRFNLIAYDFNHDGLCDFVVSKANYVHHGGFRARNDYKNTETIFVRSTGSGFSVFKDIVTNDCESANCSHVFLGDFTGDGDPQLANFGKRLLYPGDKTDDMIHIYRIGSDMANKGRVSSITNGLGKVTYITYKPGTDPSVYSFGKAGSYPVNTYTLPIALVSEVSVSNGAAASQTTKYKYEGAKVHIAGRGFLGFTKVSDENTTLGVKEETEITKWDENRWIPTESKSTTTQGGKTSVVQSVATVTDAGAGNYFSYISGKTIKDFDGNTATVSSTYDVSKGVPVSETVYNDGSDMYKRVNYGGYIQKAGMWMPSSIERIQKHKDDSRPFAVKTSYTYNDKGDILTTIDHDGSSLPLKTINTYDVYGNILTSVSTGSGVGSNTKVNVYDNSGRFVTKASESATSMVNTFTYDLWGDVLTEKDETNPNAALTTKYEYDGWGMMTCKTDPAGISTTITTGWCNGYNSLKYYVKTSPANGAWTKTYYDNCGHELLVKSVGPNNIAVSKTTSYNDKGQVSKVVNNTGKLSVSETFTYDDRGRLASDALSTGKTTSYSYGNRTVTTTVAGRSYTKATDAWGNVVKSTDPVSEVSYVYSSCGKPSAVKAAGATTTFAYDDVANQISMTDPDAGTTTYTYAADGKILSEKDARGVKTVNTYDNKGRLVSSLIGNTKLTHTYGNSGNGSNRLIRSEYGKNSVSYVYDEYGRVISESRNVFGKGTFNFSYVYNDKNQLAQVTYPGGLSVSYTYDDFGNKIQTTAGNDVIWKLKDYDGLATSSVFNDKLTTVRTLDSNGFEKNIKLTNGSSVVENFDESYDAITGNLLSRQRNSNTIERFGYDALDRLVSVSKGSVEVMKVNYAENGNIKYKTGIGNYTYNEGTRPHAVSMVDNTDKQISAETVSTEFNEWNKISKISDASGHEMSVDYGPDGLRWLSTLKNGNNTTRTTVYADDYEQITENGTTRDFYYLDGNTIIIRQGGTVKAYQAFTDNLGSILSVVDKDGNKVFDASYDAWGKQTVTVNTIGLHRGYCGHEMLPEFDLINMNGRLYDPTIGRFLSPDNFVQEPENSQNFNRYTYCLNNPLKYTDPSGELSEVLAFAIFSMASSMMQAASNGDNVWKAGALSILSSAATYGIGELFQGAGTFGKELLRAAMHGLSSGVFAALNGDNFGSAFISGAAASGIGSIHMDQTLMLASSTAMGGAMAWATGGDFLNGALQGLSIGFLNHAMHDDPQSVSSQQDDQDFPNMLPEVIVTAKAPTYAIYFASSLAATRVSSYSLSVIRTSMAEAGVYSVTISSTARTPEEQVNAMYYNLKNNKVCRYAPAGRAVERRYPDKKQMLQEVYRQGPSRVSKHCADYKKLNVIDIAPSSVSKKAAFHRALLNNRKISRVLDPWTVTKDPVFHIEIPQP